MNKILLFVVAVCLHTALLAQTIAFWDFNSNPGDGNTATGTLTPATGVGTITTIGGTGVAYATGATSIDPNTTDNSGLQTTPYPAQGAANKTAGIQN